MSTRGEDPMAGDECQGNAAPYVLGALPDAEHEAFLAHLQTCAVCREEVAALQSVAAALPAAVPQHEAPEGLKRRIMAEVGREAELIAPASSRSAREPAPRRRLSFVFGPLAAGIAVIAIIAIVLAGSGGPSSGATRLIRAEVNAPGATALVRVQNQRAELSLANMPATSPGRVYEVWIKRGGAPQPTDALFTVTSRGAATVGVPGSVAGVKEVLVTSEPLGGSRVPTSTPAIIARLG
jgi:anti-sigma-K factor RskA